MKHVSEKTGILFALKHNKQGRKQTNFFLNIQFCLHMLKVAWTKQYEYEVYILFRPSIILLRNLEKLENFFAPLKTWLFKLLYRILIIREL